MYFSIISFSYQKLSLQELSNCQISSEDLEEKLKLVQKKLKISEIFCLNTCNRVVFFMSKKTV
jgi:glutamyl-tRNA reductase